MTPVARIKVKPNLPAGRDPGPNRNDLNERLRGRLFQKGGVILLAGRAVSWQISGRTEVMPDVSAVLPP